MTDYVGGPPPDERSIAITRGFDKKFSLRRRDVNGDPVDWDADVFIDIDIDRAAPTRVEATITNSLAEFRIESDTCDLIKNGVKWRAGMSQAGSPSLETVLIVGRFARHDG